MNHFWKIISWIVTRRSIRNWLIGRSFLTPYSNIVHDGEIYMWRFWLFNRYDGKGRHIPWLPSIRIHHIVRPDQSRHLHNHPWDARTIILEGWYCEELEDRKYRWREQGDTTAIQNDLYHRIQQVPCSGTWTLFITYSKSHQWGFKVDGEFVPYRKYLGVDDKAAA